MKKIIPLIGLATMLNTQGIEASSNMQQTTSKDTNEAIFDNFLEKENSVQKSVDYLEKEHEKVMNTYVFVLLRECNNDKEKLIKLIQKHMIIEINKIRKNRNLAELKENKQLTLIAQNHAKDMRENKFYSHINKQNEGATARAKKIGLKLNYIVENIDRESVTLQQVVNEMRMESKIHTQNILERDLTDIGVGFDVGEDGDISSIHRVLKLAKITSRAH